MIALFALLVALQAAPTELKRHVDAGLAAKRAGDLDTAVREFQRVVELAPGLAAAHVNLGAVYYEKKDYGHAIPSLRKALELNPDLPGAHGMLGVALLAQGYAAESSPHLEKAKSGEVLGVALLEAGRAREAVDKLEEALEKQPDNPDLLYYLSQAHARLAKQAFDALAERSPDSARTRQMLGETRAAAGNRDAAVRSFARLWICVPICAASTLPLVKSIWDRAITRTPSWSSARRRGWLPALGLRRSSWESC